MIIIMVLIWEHVSVCSYSSIAEVYPQTLPVYWPGHWGLGLVIGPAHSPTKEI